MLRVDAARAISKLRDYQLSQPTAWVLEAIRAAVASGATSVELQGDSNDVWLSWHGEAWPSETLPTLLDELVSPASAREGQKLRLLGTAVNSALGLGPSYIDVYRIAGGEAEKVRYLPTLIEEQEGHDSILQRPTLEKVAPPKRAGDASMFIHFRRRFGLEPLRNLFKGQPPEMLIARTSCVDLPIPIVIGSDEIGAHKNHSDLLRIDIGHDIDGFLALMRPSHAHSSGHAMMYVAEQGVHIACYAHDLQSGTRRVSPPIRFYINAERMPTNASRSEVRRNSHPISTAERQLPQLYKLLCEAIVSELADDADTKGKRREQLRESALSLLGSLIAGPGWSERARNVPQPFQLLAGLKLLRNAVGQDRAPNRGWNERVLYTGREPLALDLAPWFHGVLWLEKGDAASSELWPDQVDAKWLKILLRRARRQVRARRRFESHAKREARFDRVPGYWVRAPLDATLPGSGAPLTTPRFEGELYFWPRGRSAKITMLFEGREIEEVELDLSPLPFRAIVAAPELTPASDYKSVNRDDQYKAVSAYVLCAAIRCVEALCRDGAEGFAMEMATSSKERRALAYGAMETMYKLGLSVATDSVLANYPAWELAGGGWASLTELRAESAVGCVANKLHRTVAASGRVTVVADPKGRTYLRFLLEPETALVFYGNHRVGLYSNVSKTLARGFTQRLSGVVALAIQDDDCQGAIAWGLLNNELRIYHRLKRLAAVAASASVHGATVAVDSDKVIPQHGWDGVRDDAGLGTRDFEEWHVAMVRAYALALIGRRPREFWTSAGGSLLSTPGKIFVSAVMEAEDAVQLLGETFEALGAAPIFEVLGGERVSADDLAASFPNVIDYIESPPPEAMLEEDWQPLVASKAIASFAGRLADRKITHALWQLTRRAENRMRKARLSAHRSKAKIKAQSLLKQCTSVTEFETSGAKGLIGIGGRAGQHLHVLLEERLLTSTKVPSGLTIVAALELDPSLITADLESVKPPALGRLHRELQAAAPRILEARLQADNTAMSTDAAFRVFFGRWLQAEGPDSEDIAKIRDMVCFYDQRGQVLALRDVLEGAFLRLSSYDAQPWTEAMDGATRDKLDDPVLAVSEDTIVPLMSIFQELCDEILIVDVTDEIRKLQIARRIERGLLLSPRVPVDATLKRSLTDLIGSEMVGEIGFYDGPTSHVRICEEGTEKAREEIDLLPIVVVAVEDPTLLARTKSHKSIAGRFGDKAKLKLRVGNLAQLLVESVLAADTTVPEWLRRQFSLALCTGDLKVGEIPKLKSGAFFRSTRGDWVSWQDLLKQVERFGDVWYVPHGETREPLDPLRIAIVLPLAEVGYAADALHLVDGRVELTLDEVAKKNESRPPVNELALSKEQSAAAITTMELRGTSGVRGLVAPLLPQKASARGVCAHLRMKYIGDAVDPCTWPTLAVIDDPEITPNRSWSAPTKDDRWQVVCKAISKASDQALMKFMPSPTGILSSHWVGRWVDGRRPNYRETGNTAVRGRLWLDGNTEGGVITVRGAGIDTSYHPRATFRGMNFPLPIFGDLLIHSESIVRVDEVVSEVVEIVYPRLLTQVSSLKKAKADHKAAHIAIGLATGYAKSKSMKKTEFSCFSPKSLNAEELVDLTQSDSLVAMLDETASVQPPEGLAFIREDTELSRAIERLLAGRLIDLAVAPETESFEIEIADLSLSVADAKARANIHVLDSLADDLHKRLVHLGLHTVFGYIRVLHDTATPPMQLRDGELLLAGQSKMLRSLHAQRMSGDTIHESCLDLLVAHAITILNHGHTSVTDATEQRALLTMMRIER